jgi:hypothetical protein
MIIEGEFYLDISPPIQWVPGAFPPGVKRPGREADHSLPSTAEVKECVELYFHSTPPIRLHGLVLSQAEGLYLYHVLDNYIRHFGFCLCFSVQVQGQTVSTLWDFLITVGPHKRLTYFVSRRWTVPKGNSPIIVLQCCHKSSEGLCLYY